MALLSRIPKASVLGALLSAALIAAAPAHGAAPPSVFVRVEGAGTTLLPQTLVHTTVAARVKGNACRGSSAAGALNVATGGDWAGSYSSKYKDYLVGSILGERPMGNNFWTLWINGVSSSSGACSTPLHPGDHELWFDCVADSNFNCTNDPLRLRVPASARVGSVVSGSVSQLDGAGHGSPLAGAAVNGVGAAGVSGSHGTVRIVAHRAGAITLQAAKSGATPSDPVTICVYRRHPSECGAALAGPRVHVAGIREHQVFRLGPRQLRGTVGPDAAGLIDVSLGLLRHAPGGRCSYYDGQRAAWRGIACAARPPRFSIGAAANWSYLLPGRLAAGRYRLLVIARDGDGRQTRLQPGASALDFTVKR